MFDLVILIFDAFFSLRLPILDYIDRFARYLIDRLDPWCI